MLGFALSGFLGAPRSEIRAGEYMEAVSGDHHDAGWAGQTLTSPNGQFRLEMQGDGNLVIYGPGNAVLRAWGAGGGRTTFNLQTDGNLVLYRNGRAIWASDTYGRGGGGRLVMQDDANLVLYFGNAAAWSSETNGGRQYDDRSGFTKALSAAGSVIAPVVHLATSPFEAAAAIARGDNVVSTIANHFKDQVKNVKEVAPLVQTVISFVPGVGAGVNAAIAAGTAIAQGASITDALVAGAKNALPGGPMAAAAFDAAWTIGKAAATGGNIGEAALQASRDAAVRQYGPVAGAAFDTGLALAHGQNVQQALVSNAANLAQSQAGELVKALARSVPMPQINLPPLNLPASIQKLGPQAVTALAPKAVTAVTSMIPRPASPVGPIGPIGPITPVVPAAAPPVRALVATLPRLGPMPAGAPRIPTLPRRAYGPYRAA